MLSLFGDPGFDFGYTWPWTHGHLVLSVLFALPAALLRLRGFRWFSAALGFFAAWSLLGFLIIQFVFGFNRPLRLPVPEFLSSGKGLVLDVGAGSGRATIMVGQGRPAVRVVALDNFSAEYIRDSPKRLVENVRRAGMEGRVEVREADMRRIPAESGSFDAVVSSYAIDHLPRADIRPTLSEVSRVLREEGEFLLAVIHRDAWLLLTYGPLILHSFRPAHSWKLMLEDTGFVVQEMGTTPGSVHFLCRKRAARS